jgi:MoaA/NifB/PqqE/SkfB family radical SAM enzyme
VVQRLTGTATAELPSLPPAAITASFDNLVSVDVYVTSQCNRRCTYCFLPSEFFTSGARMTMARFTSILNWCQRHQIPEITLLGGEPSLHPSFASMVSSASALGMGVRVVTNGARRFRRLLQEGAIGPDNLDRVAVSLDSLDESIQDDLRGKGACRDAMDTIELLSEQKVLFDINITAVRSVLGGLDELIEFAEEAGCRRVNIHWPSAMGMGSQLNADQIPRRNDWAELVDKVAKRTEKHPGFFVEIERGFLEEGEPFSGCALEDFSNLQILPDGRAYRCGLLVDQEEMASMFMMGDELRVIRPGEGEDLLRQSRSSSCDSCPATRAEGRYACIYDKPSSIRVP